MKHLSLKTIFLFALTFVLASFTTNTTFTEGNFGVSTDDPSHIELQLKSDHSFTYQDLSNAQHPIRVSGTWTLHRHSITLTSTQQARFHNVWTLTNDNQMVKSRKGMCWYRLCKQ